MTPADKARLESVADELLACSGVMGHAVVMDALSFSSVKIGTGRVRERLVAALTELIALTQGAPAPKNEAN